MTTLRLTMAQALVRFLKAQSVERDGERRPFFAGCFGIFGHGNVAGIGQALQENPDFRYYQARNEQAMVHTAAAFAKASDRLQTFACTTSIGPGATNMITAAAGATINRLPVLLLPGDIFARRNVAPVLQQLESGQTQDVSVNDCFRPVSRYWDRIYRPEQLMTSLPEAMRVLTSPAETGAVTLCLPQDVQAEAWDYPADFFEPRTWTIGRSRADQALLERAASWIRQAEAPLIIAGGGVLYSGAHDALDTFAARTGIGVAETQAGKGALHHEHPQSLGAMGVTGTPGANRVAREADLVIGVGTRYSDFTSASKTAFQRQGVRFVNINVAAFDAFKHSALPLVGDAKVTLEALLEAVGDHRLSGTYARGIADDRTAWDAAVEATYHPTGGAGLTQGAVIGAINEFSRPEDVVVGAAGSLPGDLHKLWRSRDPRGYHLEYGYSCMGYEIAGGLGVKLAAPEREVYVMVGDGSYLMMAQEIVTAIQERVKLTVILVNNHGYGSIGALSTSLGSDGFGTRYRYRSADGALGGENLPVDLAANAASLGACAITVGDRAALMSALETARSNDRTTVIVVETDTTVGTPESESWWDVPPAEVSTMEAVQDARRAFEEARPRERYL